MGKGEIARNEQFLLFPQCFQQACFPGASKGVIVWEWVIENWKNITSDQSILDIVQHCHIDFENNPPVQTSVRHQCFTVLEKKIIQNEIDKLLEMGVIEEAEHEYGQFISPIFTVPKKNGEHHMILNLKELNTYIEYHHFKMDTFETALKLKPGCFIA